VIKGPDPDIACAAQEGADFPSLVIMVDREISDPPLVLAGFRATADGAPALLAQEHRRVFIGRAAIVNGALNPDPTLAVPPVIGLLAG